MHIAGDDPHPLLMRVLTDPPTGYRRWMRPNDIIEQSRMDRDPGCQPVSLLSAPENLRRSGNTRFC
jgi:hypothetical protein